jgi:hypothetical protein
MHKLYHFKNMNRILRHNLCIMHKLYVIEIQVALFNPLDQTHVPNGVHH